MKNLRKAELIVLGATLLVISFTAGYFTGRNSGTHVISFDQIKSQPVAVAVVSSDEAPSAAAPSASTSSMTSAAPSFSPSASIQATPQISAAEDKLNINTATLRELDTLPGIGEVLAQRIIDYRQKIGGFKSIEQIQDVDGIGEKKFEAFKDMITV